MGGGYTGPTTYHGGCNMGIDQRVPRGKTAAEIYLSVIPIESRFCYAMGNGVISREAEGKRLNIFYIYIIIRLRSRAIFLYFFLLHIPITE